MRPLAPEISLLVGLFVSACGDDHQVPFRLDAGRRTEGPSTGNGAEDRRPTARTFDEGTRRIDVEGAPLEVEGSIRALWADDVDRDGDRDAVVIASGPQLRVSFARRDGSSFEPLRDLGTAPADGCTLGEPALEPLGAAWLVARASVTCGETSRRELWVLATDRSPRALEHLAILDPNGRAPGTVELALATGDRDSDGHDDLVVTVSVDTEEDEPATIELPWLDRPSGLARDAAEPERTFGDRAREALRLLRREPDRALSESRRVVALHAAICREPGRARLRVGEADGIACGSSEGAGRAATTVVRAHAQRGRLLDALAAEEYMHTPGLRMNDERWTTARDAIASAPPTAGVTLREGPTHNPPSAQIARLSALAFLDEDRLVMRGEPTRAWNLATGAEEALPSADVRILDPSGAYAVAQIERRCAGHVLRIVPQRSIVFGQALGSTHSTPLIAAREAPSGAPCPDLTPALRRDDGGYRALGWAPQGVVVARGAAITVVPLDVSAQGAGAPEVLAPGALPPAPLPPGAITADGRFLAEVRGVGVILHQLAPSPSSTLLWPEGWAAREGDVSDPAVSPSGRRVAVLRGGRVLVLERR